MHVDFGRVAADYARHRAGFPEAFFDRLASLGIARPGARVLDVGTGTGSVARGLARRGCAVTGLDPSAALLEQARRLDAEAGVATEDVVASAESTGRADASVDVITAGQCWHWFDGARAAGEARRVLVPGGVLVIAHFDWLSLQGNVAAATEQLILRHNPGWKFGAGTGMYPAWLADCALAGFRGLETFSFDLAVPYDHQGWRARIRASAGVGASLPPDAVARFDADLQEVLTRQFPTEPLAILHRVWAVIARAP
jgi:SAM-dependent methyltransferase